MAVALDYFVKRKEVAVVEAEVYGVMPVNTAAE